MFLPTRKGLVRIYPLPDLFFSLRLFTRAKLSISVEVASSHNATQAAQSSITVGESRQNFAKSDYNWSRSGCNFTQSFQNSTDFRPNILQANYNSTNFPQGATDPTEFYQVSPDSDENVDGFPARNISQPNVSLDTPLLIIFFLQLSISVSQFR